MPLYPKLILPLQIDLAMGNDGTCSGARLTQAPKEPALSAIRGSRSWAGTSGQCRWAKLVEVMASMGNKVRAACDV